jgi:hypothetical protein
VRKTPTPDKSDNRKLEIHMDGNSVNQPCRAVGSIITSTAMPYVREDDFSFAGGPALN